MQKKIKDKELKMLRVLLSPETYSKVEEAAAKEDRKLSPMARRIIEQWLEWQKQEKA